MRYQAIRFGRAACCAAALLSLSAISADAHHGPAHAAPHAHSATMPAVAPMACPPAPYGPYVNHAHAAPPFRWGWFGAEHVYPRVQWGRDYNGELMRWSKQRRY